MRQSHLWLMFGQFLASSPSWDSRTHVSALGAEHCLASVSWRRPLWLQCGSVRFHCDREWLTEGGGVRREGHYYYYYYYYYFIPTSTIIIIIIINMMPLTAVWHWQSECQYAASHCRLTLTVWVSICCLSLPFDTDSLSAVWHWQSECQ